MLSELNYYAFIEDTISAKRSRKNKASFFKDKLKAKDTHTPTPLSGQYLRHAHIARAVMAMDSCFTLIGAHQHDIDVHCYHYLGDMAVRMREVLTRLWDVVCVPLSLSLTIFFLVLFDDKIAITIIMIAIDSHSVTFVRLIFAGNVVL